MPLFSWFGRRPPEHRLARPRRQGPPAEGFRPVLERLEDRTLLAGDFGFAVGVGGPLRDLAAAVATDSSGNAYVTGEFHGKVSFSPTVSLTSAGLADIFVAKYGSDGHLIWAQDMGGPGNDAGTGIAVDTAGNVYAAGYFNGTAAFTTGHTLTSAGDRDIFVVKLDTAGNFVWADHMGGKGIDQAMGIAVDSSGNVYTTGYFQGTADFDPGSGSHNLTSAGNSDIFVEKLDSSGAFVWADRMGGKAMDRARGITVDASGQVDVTGFFYSHTANFNPGGTTNLTGAGNSDGFVEQLNNDGTFSFAKGVGGKGNDKGTAIAVDSSGNVYTTGFFTGTADFGVGSSGHTLTSAGGKDIFVAKLTSSGAFGFAERMGGKGDDEGRGIAVDSAGNVYTTGVFSGTADFDPGSGSHTLTSRGHTDVFVSKLNASGAFVYAKQLGGPGADVGRGIAVDTLGHVYAAGFFFQTANFDPGPGGHDLTSAGRQDIFLSQLTDDISPVAVNDTATTTGTTPVNIDVTANDTDADGTIDKTTVHIVSQPSNGAISAVDATTGVVTYAANGGFTGTDSFTYTVKDNVGLVSNVATVTVTVS